MIFELLYHITQQQYEVRFSGSFEEMITVTYCDAVGKYIRHEHIGTPGEPGLEDSLKKSLIQFLKEIDGGGEPKRDALADLPDKA